MSCRPSAGRDIPATMAVTPVGVVAADCASGSTAHGMPRDTARCWRWSCHQPASPSSRTTRPTRTWSRNGAVIPWEVSRGRWRCAHTATFPARADRPRCQRSMAATGCTGSGSRSTTTSLPHQQHSACRLAGGLGYRPGRCRTARCRMGCGAETLVLRHRDPARRFVFSVRASGTGAVSAHVGGRRMVVHCRDVRVRRVGTGPMAGAHAHIGDETRCDGTRPSSRRIVGIRRGMATPHRTDRPQR